MVHRGLEISARGLIASITKISFGRVRTDAAVFTQARLLSAHGCVINIGACGEAGDE